uniref:Uncharacterized protein n=2 Tax=Clytia hemisphaerica TaxID=252671 RepID=A0A7M5V1V4_9CNID
MNFYLVSSNNLFGFSSNTLKDLTQHFKAAGRMKFLIFAFLLIWCLHDHVEGGGMAELVITALTGWAEMGPGESDGGEGQEIDKEMKEAQGICALLEGCKTSAMGKCFSGDDHSCTKCYYDRGTVDARNIMRADFYDFDEAQLRQCFEAEQNCYTGRTPEYHADVSQVVEEMLDFMLLKGTSVAERYQGAVFKNVNVPHFQNLKTLYETKFCGEGCVAELYEGCSEYVNMREVKDWCLTVFDWVSKDIPNLKGPPSYILMLVGKLSEKLRGTSNEFSTPSELTCTGSEGCWHNFVPRWVITTIRDGQDGALVAAALTSAMLTADWFPKINKHGGFDSDFGFAVQHSLWLAIYAGRLGISLKVKTTLQGTEPVDYGTSILCNRGEAENHELGTGSVFASLCTLFTGARHNIDLKFRPEIMSRHSMGCTEKTTGMAFIRPGDWVNTHYRTKSKSLENRDPKAVCVGGGSMKYGLAFIDRRKLTTVEITKRGVTLYPPSIGESLRNTVRPTCGHIQSFTKRVPFEECGLRGYGSVCKWKPVW